MSFLNQSINNNTGIQNFEGSNTFLNWFNSNKGRYIDVQMAGYIFGGRHGEAPQLLKRYTFVPPNMLKIFFNTTETLEITNPSSFMIGKHNELIIEKANQVCFGWHYYGRPQTPENWCTEIYELKCEDIVERKINGPICDVISTPKIITFHLDIGWFIKLS